MLSIGLPGATDVALLRRLAPRIEAAGYRALWLNDGSGESLDGLAAVAAETTTLGLATGVIAVDRHPVAWISERLRDLRLPAERTRIGIGSGGAARGLTLLRDAVAGLHSAVTVPVIVAGLGPLTRRLAAEVAEGVLLSWLPLAQARAAIADLRAQAPAGRTPTGILYARAIGDPDARAALEAEIARYAAIPAYAANFNRLGIAPIGATVDLTAGPGEPGDVRALEAEVDELVLRVITRHGTEDEILGVIEAGAPSR